MNKGMKALLYIILTGAAVIVSLSFLLVGSVASLVGMSTVAAVCITVSMAVFLGTGAILLLSGN